MAVILLLEKNLEAYVILKKYMNDSFAYNI